VIGGLNIEVFAAVPRGDMSITVYCRSLKSMVVMRKFLSMDRPYYLPLAITHFFPRADELFNKLIARHKGGLLGSKEPTMGNKLPGQIRDVANTFIPLNYIHSN
jgi:hypothetical protein